MSPIRNCILESRPLKENKIWGQLSFALASSCGTEQLTKTCAGADGVIATPRARLMRRARSSQSAAKRWWGISTAMRCAGDCNGVGRTEGRGLVYDESGRG